MPDPPRLAFSAEDLSRAWDEWRCNCGPAALAACLGSPLEAVRPHLGDFEKKGYLSPTMMRDAIVSAGFKEYVKHPDFPSRFPIHGLVRVQWGGPWLKPGVPPRAAYRYTHWIASKLTDHALWIFDVNAGWEPFPMWCEATAPLIAASIKRADGTWSFTHRWEVRRAEPGS